MDVTKLYKWIYALGPWMSPNLINLSALGPWMSPNHLNLYALRPWTLNIYTLWTLWIYRAMDATNPYKFINIGAMDVTKPNIIYMLWGHVCSKPVNLWDHGCHQTLCNLNALRPWMSPNPLNLYALVPWMLPNHLNLNALVPWMSPYKCLGPLFHQAQ